MKKFNTGGCPCLYVEPCIDRCSCVVLGSSSGCGRCCSYGSIDQREERAAVIAELIDQELTPEPGGDYGFIPLDRGRTFVRQSSVEGIRWIKEYDEQGARWYVEVAISELGLIRLYNEDILSLMTVLGLPTDPPGQQSAEVE